MRVVGALVAVLVLAGCGGAGDGSLTGAGASTLPSPAASSPGPSAPTGPLVVFSRTGGIAGQQVTLTVQQDGSAQVAGRRQATWTLSAGQLDGLRRALADADLRPVAPSGEPVLDGYRYRVTYAGRTVLLSGDPVPAGAATAVEQLSTLALGP